MAFEDLLKSGQDTNARKPSGSVLNLASSLAVTHHDQVLKREELLQSIMIAQGEYDYLTLRFKAGQTDLLNDLLIKKSFLLEKNILLTSLSSVVSTGDLIGVNRQSDQLTRYRMELEAAKQAQKNHNQYLEQLKQEVSVGVDFEGTMIDSLDTYITVISEKLRFGGIVDQGRVSRLCGFASLAAKKGDLVLALRAYSIAGMIVSIKDDFKKILKKAKKAKNPQVQEAEQLLNNLLPKSQKK